MARYRQYVTSVLGTHSAAQGLQDSFTTQPFHFPGTWVKSCVGGGIWRCNKKVIRKGGGIRSKAAYVKSREYKCVMNAAGKSRKESNVCMYG